MSLPHHALHRWRASLLSPWTELDVVNGVVEERCKDRVRRFPLTDLTRITLRTRAMVPSGMVILTFRDGASITCLDWAPQGMGSQRRDRGSLVLALGLIVDALPQAQRQRVEARVEHSHAGVTLTAGLVTALVAGATALIVGLTAPWPTSQEQILGTLCQGASAIALGGVVLVGMAARGWPTDARAWNPWVEGLPEGWRLNRLELLDATSTHLLWSMARSAPRPSWPTLLPPPLTEPQPSSPAPDLATFLAPLPPTEEVLVVPGATWRRTVDRVERTTPQGTTTWPLAELQEMRWVRGLGRRTLIMTLAASPIRITHGPRPLATWAAGLRATNPALPATVEEEPLRRLVAGGCLLVAIVAGLGLAVVGVHELMEPHRHRPWETLKGLVVCLGLVGGAVLGPPSWLKTSPGRRRWTAGDPERA